LSVAIDRKRKLLVGQNKGGEKQEDNKNRNRMLKQQKRILAECIKQSEEHEEM